MTPDPHSLQAFPDHPQTPDGRRVYDPRCWMCRAITVQPLPPNPLPPELTDALDRVAGRDRGGSDA